MNCQEFRKAWLNETDSDTLSHIEHCNECLTWIDASFTSNEEVRFMKEYPHPSAQLENRIMQAIYETAGQGPPLSAATHALPSKQPFTKISRRFPVVTWVSAAGILLTVGLLSYQGLTSEGQSINMASTAMKSASQSAPMAVSIPAESTGSEPAVQAKTYGDTVPETKQAEPQSVVPNQAAAALTTTEQVPAPKAPPVSEPTNQIALMAAPDKSVAATQHHPVLLARKATPQVIAKADEQAKTAAPVAAQPVAPSNSITAVPEEEQPVVVSGPPAITAYPEQADGTSSDNASQTNTAALADTAITLSSFSDVQTAVQASDLPVPSIEKLPNGFALGSISLKYESETSKHVTNISSIYQRNTDTININVVRNLHGNRSLSIPGTFNATQLFLVGGEQAIGVTYAQDASAPPDQPVWHAVHFNTLIENQSLYVVLTASGIRLDELTEVAKQLAWKTQ